MRITGKTIIAVSSVIVFGGVALLTAINIKDIRDEEKEAQEEARRKNMNREPDEPEVEAEAPKSTGEVVVEALKRTGQDVVDTLTSDPAAVAFCAGLGVLSYVTYSAGHNDGYDSGSSKGVRKGYAYGFAAGMQCDADICATANPETYNQIFENMKIYMRLHPDAKRVDVESYMKREGYIENVKEIYNSWRAKS